MHNNITFIGNKNNWEYSIIVLGLQKLAKCDDITKNLIRISNGTYIVCKSSM